MERRIHKSGIEKIHKDLEAPKIVNQKRLVIDALEGDISAFKKDLKKIKVKKNQIPEDIKDRVNKNSAAKNSEKLKLLLAKNRIVESIFNHFIEELEHYINGYWILDNIIDARGRPVKSEKKYAYEFIESYMNNNSGKYPSGAELHKDLKSLFLKLNSENPQNKLYCPAQRTCNDWIKRLKRNSDLISKQ